MFELFLDEISQELSCLSTKDEGFGGGNTLRIQRRCGDVLSLEIAGRPRSGLGSLDGKRHGGSVRWQLLVIIGFRSFSTGCHQLVVTSRDVRLFIGFSTSCSPLLLLVIS